MSALAPLLGIERTCDFMSTRPRLMIPTTVLIALVALLATVLSLRAEGSKPEEPQAEQPYTDQLGDSQVTSVKREITKGVHGQLCPKLVGRATGVARIHRTAIMPVIIAITKTKTAVRPLASDTRAGPGQYPASPQPMPKITEPEMRGVSMAVDVGTLKRGDQSGRPRPNTIR